MNARTGISIALIGFIIVSIIYLVINETGTKELAKTDTENVNTQDKESCTDCDDASACSDSKNAKVSTKDVVEKDLENHADEAIEASNAVDKSDDVKIFAYYFHGEVRCTTCNTIESYARENLKTNFNQEMKSGTIVFKEINIDNDENEHYIEDYELSSSSLVIAKFENGKRTKWKNLEQVWTLVHDKPEFLKYTREETSKYLEQKL
jgi:hypothetical protein